jgi:tripartite-type tricarboxylate transporter receptor subunit TctC
MLALVCFAHAQDFPSRPVTIVLPFGAGGPLEADIRRVGSHLEKVWGRPVLIEARPGAGGLIGSEAVVKAAADGHTLLWGFAAISAYKVLYKELRFDPLKDLAPVSLLVNTPSGLFTSSQLPAKNADEFVALIKANPGKYNYASVGRTTQYMLMEAFKAATGTNLVEVSFTTQAQIAQGLLRNDVHLANLPLDKAMKAQVEAGKATPLLMLGDRRALIFPDIPTTAEKGWNVPNNGWQAMFAPAATPQPIIERIAAEIARYTSLPETRATSQNTGMDMSSSTPQQLRQLVERDAKLWASVAASVGLQPQ